MTSLEQQVQDAQQKQPPLPTMQIKLPKALKERWRAAVALTGVVHNDALVAVLEDGCAKLEALAETLPPKGAAGGAAK